MAEKWMCVEACLDANGEVYLVPDLSRASGGTGMQRHFLGSEIDEARAGEPTFAGKRRPCKQVVSLTRNTHLEDEFAAGTMRRIGPRFIVARDADEARKKLSEPTLAPKKKEAQ